MYNLRQNGKPLVQYYTSLSTLWEELEAINDLPSLTTTSDEIKTLLTAIQVQKDESRLFQFLNGLDDVFGQQRRQLLMMSPLPSVEMACAVIQQEESQHDILQTHSGNEDISAMFSKGVHVSSEKSVMCNVCKKKGHTTDTCWSVVRYPKWHYKIMRPPARGGGQSGRWNGQRTSGPRSGKHSTNVRGK